MRETCDSERGGLFLDFLRDDCGASGFDRRSGAQLHADWPEPWSKSHPERTTSASYVPIGVTMRRCRYSVHEVRTGAALFAVLVDLASEELALDAVADCMSAGASLTGGSKTICVFRAHRSRWQRGRNRRRRRNGRGPCS